MPINKLLALDPEVVQRAFLKSREADANAAQASKLPAPTSQQGRQRKATGESITSMIRRLKDGTPAERAQARMLQDALEKRKRIPGSVEWIEARKEAAARQRRKDQRKARKQSRKVR